MSFVSKNAKLYVLPKVINYALKHQLQGVHEQININGKSVRKMVRNETRVDLDALTGQQPASAKLKALISLPTSSNPGRVMQSTQRPSFFRCCRFRQQRSTALRPQTDDSPA